MATADQLEASVKSTIEGIDSFVLSMTSTNAPDAIYLRDLHLGVHYNEMSNYQKSTKPSESFVTKAFSQEEANESFREYLANPHSTNLGLAFDIDVQARELAENVIRSESKKSGMSYVLAIRSAIDIFQMAYLKKFLYP